MTVSHLVSFQFLFSIFYIRHETFFTFFDYVLKDTCFLYHFYCFFIFKICFNLS